MIQFVIKIKNCIRFMNYVIPQRQMLENETTILYCILEKYYFGEYCTKGDNIIHNVICMHNVVLQINLQLHAGIKWFT